MKKLRAQVIKYAKKLRCNIMIHTNGGVGKQNLYRLIAQDLEDFPQGVITFSIDGLEDTNHLYRKNAKWNSHSRYRYTKVLGKTNPQARIPNRINTRTEPPDSTDV